MCWLGKVSRTGYYRAWRKRAPEAEEMSLREAIHTVVFEHRYYGYRRVTALLRQQDRLVNHKRVARLMRRDGLHALCPKRWSKTTDSGAGCAGLSEPLAEAGGQWSESDLGS